MTILTLAPRDLLASVSTVGFLRNAYQLLSASEGSKSNSGRGLVFKTILQIMVIVRNFIFKLSGQC